MYCNIVIWIKCCWHPCSKAQICTTLHCNLHRNMAETNYENII